MTPNPFTQVYDALWTQVLAHERLQDLVKPVTYAHSGQAVNPLKDVVQHADLPELILSNEGTTGGNLHATSSTTDIQRAYAFTINTGDFRVNEKLHQIEWFLFCALTNWRSVLSALTWNEKPFVTKAQLLDVSEGLSMPDRNRGILGWSAIWKCEVSMVFKSSDLLAELTA